MATLNLVDLDENSYKMLELLASKKWKNLGYNEDRQYTPEELASEIIKEWVKPYLEAVDKLNKGK